MNEPATQLTLIEPTPQRNAAVTPMQLLQIATEKGADVAQLERLMDLQLKWEANEARKAFVAAKAAFYAEMPEITKNKHVGFISKNTDDRTDYWHATLDHVIEVTAPILAKHGLTHAWVPNTTDNLIEVACVLTHVMGHSERVSLRAPADGSGKKNSVQAIGSTVTYLERYTFLAVTGLAAKQQDDDGGRGGADFVTTDQADLLQSMVESTGSDRDRFLKWAGAESYSMIPASKFEAAKAFLNRKAGGK